MRDEEESTKLRGRQSEALWVRRTVFPFVLCCKGEFKDFRKKSGRHAVIKWKREARTTKAEVIILIKAPERTQ